MNSSICDPAEKSQLAKSDFMKGQKSTTSTSTNISNTNKNIKTNKKISIICLGSRGDFQPYLALALELKAVGFCVRLLSVVTFAKFAQDFGVDFVTIKDECGDKAIREDETVKAFIEGTGNIREIFKNMLENEKRIAPFAVKAFTYEMKNHTPDLLIYGTLCEYYGCYAKHINNLPVLEVKLQAFTHDPKRAMLGFPTLPFGLHYYLVKAMMGMIYNTTFKALDDAMEVIGSPKLQDVYTRKHFNQDSKMKLDGKSNMIVCEPTFFKHILSPQVSKSMLTFVGPLVLDAKTQTSANSSSNDKDGESAFGGDITQKQIDGFINLKPDSKPVYIGWGSMLCKSPEYMVKLAASALQNCGERAIVLGSVAELTFDLLKRSTTDEQLIAYAKENILFVKKAAHESLFPKVKCIVHHGGAGTTNAALRSGVPSIITPFIFDQFDHANILNKLGIGYGFSKHMKEIKEEDLGKAINDVVSNMEMRERAREVGNRMREEDGNRILVQKIVKLMNEGDGIGESNEEGLEEGRSKKKDSRNMAENKFGRRAALRARKPWKLGRK